MSARRRDRKTPEGPQLALDEAYALQSTEEFSDADRFPAIRMLRDKARAVKHSKKKLKLLAQSLHQEEANRFDHLVHAEWKGRQIGRFEHLQGRVNNLTYHFIFALVEHTPTEDVSGFIAFYDTTEQKLDEIHTLLCIPKAGINRYTVLVRLVYLLSYVRNGIQTEDQIGLMDKCEFNEVVDELFDNFTREVLTDAQPLDVSVGVGSGLFALTKRIMAKYPNTAPVFGEQVPLMAHLRTITDLPNVIQRLGADGARQIASENFDPSKCRVLRGLTLRGAEGGASGESSRGRPELEGPEPPKMIGHASKQGVPPTHRQRPEQERPLAAARALAADPTLAAVEECLSARPDFLQGIEAIEDGSLSEYLSLRVKLEGMKQEKLANDARRANASQKSAELSREQGAVASREGKSTKQRQ